MANEILYADQWFQDRLYGDTSFRTLMNGRVYNTETPQGVVTPYCVFQFLTANDLVVPGDTRVWSQMVYLAKIVQRFTPGVAMDFAGLGMMADALDARLAGVSGPITGGGYVYSCRRDFPLSIPEGDYRHLGGQYRLRVQV